MKRRIILTALLLLLTGCQQTPEQARRELAELGVEFTAPVFHASAENGDVVVVELFLTAGMNPDITEEDGVTPLMRAVLKNNVGIARALLDSGAKVDIHEKDGMTLLDVAALGSHIEMAKLLAGAGDEISRSALTDAKLRGDTEIVELFESTELIAADYETLAISSIRKMALSQRIYSRTVGKGTYATDLEALGKRRPMSTWTTEELLRELEQDTPAGGNYVPLIDSVLSSGTKDGYAFSTSGDADTFTVNARPLAYGSTGTRNFFSDGSLVIRYTSEDRPATVEDPPIGQ
jgi:hypothetical protein